MALGLNLNADIVRTLKQNNSMQEIWESVKTWFLSLGETYGVDPIIFGSIYVGAIPFFTLSVAWIVRNYRKDKPITIPVLCAGFFFVSAYLYLFIVGENIPWWVYVLLGAMIAYGAWSTYQSTKKKALKAKEEKDDD
ncbi:hypothetical protein Oweho_0411 [Owenweeksia hongkongensis DSM 17368]|uniref:Uncharacterized protein n=2 Tax=Owenweeksia TaxID=267986 RepID=G8QZ46_OWEHD|nr:hypothetical protein Oweho_0411 [Owenweeksia hongkongensis DSM 17368]